MAIMLLFILLHLLLSLTALDCQTPGQGLLEKLLYFNIASSYFHNPFFVSRTGKTKPVRFF